MDRFGASAPAGELFEKFGITADNTVAKVKELLG
jgi:transketolase